MNVPSLLPSYADLNVSFQVESGSLAQSHFPDIYREFESLQAQVRRAAHDYIISPQAGSVPLEVRNIEVRAFTHLCCWVKKHAVRSGFSHVFQVARSLGILDEVNRMKVVPGTSPSSKQTNKNARYMEVSKTYMAACRDSVFVIWRVVGAPSSHTHPPDSV